MRNVLRLFRNDLRRVFRNVVSVIIALGLVVMPSIFAWYNILACWNVFDNTGNLTVAVANADEGYQSDLVPLKVNVGEQVIAALRANEDIDWVFTDEAEAIDGAKAGRYYAAVVIPPDFSRDMLTFYSDDAQRASIVYYANEKKSAIAPKITDKGADSVSYQVNSVFAETLSEISLAAAESLARYAERSDAEGRLGDLASHLKALSEDAGKAGQALRLFANLADASWQLLDRSAALVDDAQAQSDEAADRLAQGVDGLEELAQDLRDAIDQLAGALGASANSFRALPQAADGLFDAAAAQEEASADALRQRADDLRSQVEQWRSLRADLEALEAQAEEVGGAGLAEGLGEADGSRAGAGALAGSAAMLDEPIAKAEDAVARLQEAADAAEAGGDLVAQRAAVNNAALAAADSMDELRQRFEDELKPALEGLADTVSSLAAHAEASMGRIQAAGGRLSSSLATAQGALGGASGRIGAMAATLEEASEELGALADDLTEALAAGDADSVRALLGSDVQALAAALAAPVGLERIAVFPAENFGSAMAPLYTTLALFIGSLLILVVVKPTVSKVARRSLDDPKPRQLFFGRFCTMGAFSLAQTTLMGLGNLFFLQVQAAHPWLLMLCFWVSGLVFTFMIYALVVAFANLGKAIAVLLLIVQVTGCGGSFPLQIMPGFVQALSPWLPATHVVNAMRAAMMGTYGADFWVQMGMLLLFLVPAALIGLVLRKPLARFMKWYVHEVESSKLVG